jgi:hypothetical protein
MSHPARRILFALNEPGYFRFYGPTIVELARRGWDVALVYDKPDKRGPGLSVPPESGDRVRSLGAFPGDVSPFARTLRDTMDAFRYLDPAFSRADYLRRRAERNLPLWLGGMKRITRLPRIAVSTGIRLARVVEACLPVDRAVIALLREARPDVVLVSPLVITGGSGAQETEVLKAARALRIPTIVGVASWDHLTSKGLIRIVPDAVIVWNDIQADEAVRLHRIPRTRVLVTGAQSLDRWFDRAHPEAVHAFRRTLRIDDHCGVLLWVGSSRNMAPGDSEVQFVRRWIAQVRASGNPELREAFVIIRPHPGNIEPWRDADLGDANAVVFPKSYTARALLSEAEVDAFWYSLLASRAVMGINTTAMIEAAIMRRPVFSVRDPAFAHSQQQTLHFDYLSATEGGFTTVADTLSEHVAQLERLFAEGEPDPQAAERFVERFVRPLGMHTRATSHLCDAIERVATAGEPVRMPVDAMPADTSDAISPGR